MLGRLYLYSAVSTVGIMLYCTVLYVRVQFYSQQVLPVSSLYFCTSGTVSTCTRYDGTLLNEKWTRSPPNVDRCAGSPLITPAYLFIYLAFSGILLSVVSFSVCTSGFVLHIVHLYVHVRKTNYSKCARRPPLCAFVAPLMSYADPTQF